MAFSYETLAHPDSEIRVAVILPGSFDSDLRVKFIARKLSVMKEDGPAYEALSYVWGTSDNPSYVTVQSELKSGSVSITRNLDIALRHLRYQNVARRMWIDALCINQADDQEKSIQVARMGDIFKTADITLSWLGPEENNSNNAIS
ncbi:hypothetical protein EJ07DRAFT_92521, partial [Lizonia empirigonia]